jgi:histidine triad (HIT) family protein
MSQTIFHKIIKREIPSEIVFEDEQCIAIKDISPAAPTHLLIIPKETICSLMEATSQHEQLLGHLLVVASKLAREQGIEEGGYRLVINNGVNANQTVFQLHMHLLGGRAFRWPPG